MHPAKHFEVAKPIILISVEYQKQASQGEALLPSRQRRHFRAAVFVALSVAALTFGCSIGPQATRVDVIGVWESKSGGRMEFYKNGQFKATKIALNTLCSNTEDAFQNKRTSGTGIWKLTQVPDEGPGARIVFNASDKLVRNCLMWAVFTGKRPLSEMQLRHQYGETERYRRTSATLAMTA